MLYIPLSKKSLFFSMCFCLTREIFKDDELRTSMYLSIYLKNSPSFHISTIMVRAHDNSSANRTAKNYTVAGIRPIRLSLRRVVSILIMRNSTSF